MPDEITRLSEALARDPAGMGWLPLGEALRRARRLDLAERTALRGLARHPYHADGHDLLARIAADRGALGRARDEWEMARQLEPQHVGALLGLSWLALTSGDLRTARRCWEAARDAAPHDPRVAAAARRVADAEESPPEPAQTLAPASAARGSADAALVPEGAAFVLLVDDDGFPLAGELPDDPQAAHPQARREELAAELAALAREARGTAEQLQLGVWDRLHVDGGSLGLSLAPLGGAGMALVATDGAAPAGLHRLLLERVRQRGQAWLEAL